MTNCKFKEGDIVYINKSNVLKILATKREYFNIDEPYVVYQIAVYTNNSDNEKCYRILVQGSTQFVDENDFITKKEYDMKKKKVIYKNKITNDLVIKKDDGYYLLDGDCLGTQKLNIGMIESGNDWEKISPTGRTGYQLRFDNDDKIYFVNEETDVEYHIGDKVTLNQKISFFDGKRNFIIKCFNISEKVYTNRFENVYVLTEDDRDISLTDLYK
jgi:hypothetical protein